MSEWVAGYLEQRLHIPSQRTVSAVHSLGIVAAAVIFSVFTTFILASKIAFVDRSLVGLQVGTVAPRNIFAPRSAEFVSEVITALERERAITNTPDVYDAPDGGVVRTQAEYTRLVLDYIQNIKRDPYGTPEEKLTDLQGITTLRLEPSQFEQILNTNDETWRLVDEEVITLLTRVMQQPIRETDVVSIQSRLQTQVSFRFSEEEALVIATIVKDLIRPNWFVNPDETTLAKQRVATEFTPIVRRFTRGQTIVRAGEPITAADLEALQQFGLLEVSATEQARNQSVATIQSFLLSIVIISMMGLFISRYAHELYQQPRMILLGAVIYLVFLLGSSIIPTELFYVLPTAAMSLLLVSVVGGEVSIMATLGFSIMIGFMQSQQLEHSVLVGVGGILGILSLRRQERLNQYFFSGAIIAMGYILVSAIFHFGVQQDRQGYDLIIQLLTYSLINGVLSAAVSITGLYIITVLFNLPTGMRMIELSQPNHPLLQKLLRQAPGTYQHSLQVANLAEQATSAIGGNAELVRVAALYHDIGKSVTPYFFIENQVEESNPHDTMADPYRSANLIIAHVQEGEKLARQYRLPARIRDFIREHHGTTRVEYFFRQATDQADDPDSVNEEDFRYTGPIPQSRETAIMMLADSCESTVRARRPRNRQEIGEIVQSIIESKTRDNQLDESHLTSNEIKVIRQVFVDMLHATFHPRINYPPGISVTSETPLSKRSTTLLGAGAVVDASVAQNGAAPTTRSTVQRTDIPHDADEDNTPIEEVPPLPRLEPSAIDQSDEK